MARIRGRDTAPELTVRRFLHRRGLRYRLHARDLPGRPDIVLPRYRSVVMVHGCFWHQHPGCRFATKPATRADFWASKLRSNVRRDSEQAERLQLLGWRVHVAWECHLAEPDLEELLATIRTVPKHQARPKVAAEGE